MLNRYLSIAAVLLCSAAATAPAAAAGSIFIPIGPPVYTPQPDKVTPQPDKVTPQAPTVTVTPGDYVDTGPENSSEYPQNCFTATIFGEPFKNGRQCYDAKTLSPTTGGFSLPATVSSTPNPDLVEGQPDLVEPQPPTCSQPGISIPGGFGSRDC